jgi:NAD(P)-dependent dehydrogenase (short-subunit alcohol dehydrogenase family)
MQLAPRGTSPAILISENPLTRFTGIRVNAVAPGPVFTPLQPASRPSEQMDDWEVGKLPLWGRAGMPSELAPSYVGFPTGFCCPSANIVLMQVFLASHDSNLMTGHVININSGQWIG